MYVILVWNIRALSRHKVHMNNTLIGYPLCVLHFRVWSFVWSLVLSFFFSEKNTWQGNKRRKKKKGSKSKQKTTPESAKPTIGSFKRRNQVTQDLNPGPKPITSWLPTGASCARRLVKILEGKEQQLHVTKTSFDQQSQKITCMLHISVWNSLS